MTLKRIKFQQSQAPYFIADKSGMGNRLPNLDSTVTPHPNNKSKQLVILAKIIRNLCFFWLHMFYI